MNTLPVQPALCDTPNDAFAAARHGDDFDDRWFAATDQLFHLPGDGRGHAALRAAAHPAAGDRCTGAAAPLPARTSLCAGGPACGESEPFRAAALGLPRDPAGRDRPVWADARDGERERARRIVLAADARSRDLRQPVGSRRSRREDLPAGLIGGGDDPAGFFNALTLFCAAGLLCWMLLGFAVAWWTGRL